MIIGCDACDWKSEDRPLIEEALREAEIHVETMHPPAPWNLKLEGCKE